MPASTGGKETQTRYATPVAAGNRDPATRVRATPTGKPKIKIMPNNTKWVDGPNSEPPPDGEVAIRIDGTCFGGGGLSNPLPKKVQMST